MIRLRLAMVALIVAAPAFAVQPDEMLKDPAAEARARTLSGQLRCLVCQNESIDESDADLARDIRLLIRRRIVAGESNGQIRDFLVSRYGDFILLKPPFRLSTALLWFSAPLAFAAGAFAIWGASRRKIAAPPPLTAEEERRLAELGGGGPTESPRLLAGIAVKTPPSAVPSPRLRGEG
jgi:cytochrome c-type biogenesis protein CcmH